MQTTHNYKLLKADEVADLIGCSSSTIWRWCAAKTFPEPIRIGHTTRWNSTEVEAFIENAMRSR